MLKFSKCSLADINELASSLVDCTDEDISNLASSIARRIQTSSVLTSADANIIYYVTGALVRSTLNRFSCDDCSRMLLDQSDGDNTLPILNEEGLICKDAREFVREVNRGGLLKPSANAFVTALKCWLVYLTIFSHSDLKTAFLSSFNHRAFFIGIVMYLLQNEVNNISLDCYKCKFDHNFIVDLISRCFNCMTKNLVRDFTNSHHKQANARKLNKLSGKCNK